MHCRPAGTHLQPPPENTTRVYAVCMYEIITVPLKWKKMGKLKKNYFVHSLWHPLSDLSVFIVKSFCLGAENYDKHGIGTVLNWKIAGSSITHAVRRQAGSEPLRDAVAQSRLLFTRTLRPLVLRQVDEKRNHDRHIESAK